MRTVHVPGGVGLNSGRWVVRIEGVTARSPGPDWGLPVDLTVSEGSHVGVIGPNGSGKSTLLTLIAGESTPAEGAVHLAPDVTVGHLAQVPSLQTGQTVREAVEGGVAVARSMLDRLKNVSRELGDHPSPELLDELGGVVEALDAGHGWDIEAQIMQAMSALGCPDPGERVDDLSAGERRRVALCRLLLSQPALLLLDEPSNDLDVDGSDWLERYLQSCSGTIIFASHDRQLLSTCADWIVELGRSGPRRYRGGYADYLEAKIDDFVVAGDKDAEELLALEHERGWVTSHGGARSRSSRERVSATVLLPDRPARGLGLIPIPAVPRLGHDVLSCEALSVRAGDTLVVEGLSFVLPPGAIVGILGPNGAGKSTLLRTLAGRRAPAGGAVSVGASVTIGFSDPQSLAGAEPSMTPADLISDGGELSFAGSVVAPRSFLAAFGLRGTDQDKPLRALSGGERARLNLAMTFRQQANLMLLDEPTNELDLTFRIALERALGAFQGCVMVASHDRWFLNRLATHLLVWDGTARYPARWTWVDGGLGNVPSKRAGGRTPRRLPHRLPIT